MFRPIGGFANYKLPPQLGENEELACYRQLGLTLSLPNYWQDRNELRRLVLDYLKYPSSDLARLHYMSDRLGTLDVVVRNDQYGLIIQEDIFRVCRCCGFKCQPDTIPLSTDMDTIAGLGSSTILLYEAYKSCIWMMVLATLIYSIYAIYTSIVLSPNSCWGLWHCSTTAISMSPKRIDSDQETFVDYNHQAWLGVALVIAWGIWFCWMNYRERLLKIWTNHITVSASDFSILIERLPVEITQERLQEILTDYHREINVRNNLEPFEIISFNVAEPIHIKKDELEDERLEYLKRQRSSMREEFIRWVRFRATHGGGLQFPVSDIERQTKYWQFEQVRLAIAQLVSNLSEKAKQKIIEKKGKATTNTVFVTLRNTSSASIIVENNKTQLSQIRHCLACRGQSGSRLSIKNIAIHQAPEPEDVNFDNVGVLPSSIACRKFLTFATSLIIISATFLGVFLLKRAKRQIKDSRSTSISISVLLTVINIVMGKIIKAVTYYEKNYTRIDIQRSAAIKTILAQITNMAALPFLMNAVLDKNFFRAGGLAESVYYLALTNALLSPFLKFIDYKQYWTLVKRRWSDDPVNKLYFNQKELNQTFEGKKFEVGDHYIYAVKTTVFTSFYLSLQPIIAAFSIVGLFLMYWVNKYEMIKRSKRPPPGSDIVHRTLIQLIYLCPLLFCAGALAWPWYLGELNTTRVYPYILGCIISVILFLIPLQVIFYNLITTPQDHLDYYQTRILFTSEYDRMNPATKDIATKKYFEWLKQYKQKLLHDPNTPESERRKLLNLVEEDQKDILEDYDPDGQNQEDDIMQTALKQPGNEIPEQQYYQQANSHAQSGVGLQQPWLSSPFTYTNQGQGQGTIIGSFF